MAQIWTLLLNAAKASRLTHDLQIPLWRKYRELPRGSRDALLQRRLVDANLQDIINLIYARFSSKVDSVRVSDLINSGVIAAMKLSEVYDPDVHPMTFPRYARMGILGYAELDAKLMTAGLRTGKKRGKRAAVATVVPYDTTDVGIDPAPNPELAAAFRQDLQHVAAALKQMPLAEREVIRLHFIGELTLDATAEMLGIHRNSIKDLRDCALEHLRLILGANNE